MDVSFTNVLEGARQYFQGLPAATGSTASPAAHPSESHRRNEQPPNDGNNEMPPSAATYWQQPAPQPEPAAPSHHSDPSRPPYSNNNDVRASQYQSGAYPNQESFQFSRPQSREPSYAQQYQQQTQPPHIPSSYHYPAAPSEQPQPRADLNQQAYSNNYQRSYFPPQSKATYTKQTSYPDNAYYKHAYSATPSNSYANATPRPTNSTSTASTNQTVPHHSSADGAGSYPMVVSRPMVTHNLPPIAAISGSYHHHHQRIQASVSQPPRPTVVNTAPRPRTISSSVTPITQAVNNYYRNVPSAYTNQNYQYGNNAPATTQSYTNVIMTASNSSQSSNSQYYQTQAKSNRMNGRVPPPQPQQPQPVLMNKLKRESPLDLSVKTVRTPADSTLDDVDNDARQKYFARTSASISTHNYPTYDVHSFQKSITQRSSQYVHPPTASAPKVEFHPNFNALNEFKNTKKQPLYNNVNNNAPRYPTVSIPSAAHVNSYIQSQHPPPIRYGTSSVKNGPTTEFMHNKKRVAEVPIETIPNKMPKVDAWRQTIDDQIEQRLSSYKLQQQHKFSSSSTTPNNNKPYTTGKYNFENVQQYGHYNSNHSQTYVPSPAYPQSYQPYPQQQQTSSYPLPQRPNHPTKTGAADKRVLSLLRNSLEVKEAKKLEMLKSNEHLHQQHVQHPSTDVTAPLQPKAGFINRNNVSPFTPESNTMYKLHVPRAIDSVNYDLEGKNSVDHTVIQNHANSSSDLDGLAAFLAARIRTKGERKQVGPSQSNNNLHGIIENQLKQESSTSQKKMVPAAVAPPRRRLFSRNEEETGNNNNVPLRDKSGMRSSSETSVFDFPDSDSENDMRQSLEAMRRGRKTSLKSSGVDIKVEVPSRPPSPEDDMFAQICDNFVDQLKTGSHKVTKKTRRKKGATPAVLETKVEQVLPQPEDEAEEDDDEIKFEKKQKVRRRILSSSESEISEAEAKKARPNEEPVKTKPVEEVTKANSKNEILPFVRPAKKPSFGDGSDFYPGWEEGVYKYKKSLRMPPSLIQVTRPPQFHRLSTSLPDLDSCPNSPSCSVTTEIHQQIKNRFKKIKSEPLDSDNDSNCCYNLFGKPNHYDSEGGSSINSQPANKIFDKLLEKYGGKKQRKYKKKEQDASPKIIPKSENPLELLPTPSLKENDKDFKPVVKAELGFRKETIDNFKDAFIKNNIVSDQFTAVVVLKSRTRKETRVLKQRATIKEVFGEDRPASAPPVTCVNDIQVKKELVTNEDDDDDEDNTCLNKLIKKEVVEEKIVDTKQMLKNKLLNKGRKKNNLLKNLVEKKIKSEIQDEDSNDIFDDQEMRDPDEKSETKSLDENEDGSITSKKRSKLRSIRRKFSSGFDYIRKKKKVKKEVELDANAPAVPVKQPRRLPKASPESVQDIQKEIKTWVLNKGIGETHLHRAARLGYTDITAYCLEKMECPPSPKDNAGYTPLHEACSRGHLDIAKLLLQFGANVSESAQGGIRPLHEAVENGYVEIIRLLLSYGADPKLATYSGTTPLALATDDATRSLLENHLNDVSGCGGVWNFPGPASFFDLDELSGYNMLSDPPELDAPADSDEDEVEFELSDALLPNLYTLNGEPAGDRWVLLQELSNILKVKSRDALLRQLSAASGSGTAMQANKTVLKELKMSEFLKQAHCCQFLNFGEKINPRASKIALVKYTDKVRQLLNVDSTRVSIT